MVISEVMVGKALVRVIVPARPVRLIVFASVSLPATHCWAAAPEPVFALAAVIASRRVHKPSLASAASAMLLTVIVFPAAAADTVGQDSKSDANATAEARVKYRTRRMRRLGDKRM